MTALGSAPAEWSPERTPAPSRAGWMHAGRNVDALTAKYRDLYAERNPEG